MDGRRSIEIDGFNHGAQPIPAACRVGNIVMTGGVYGMDTSNGEIPDELERQTALMFHNLRRIIEAAGTTIDRVVKVTVYVKISEARVAVNKEWLAAFPDPASRPARHTFQNEHLPANMLVQCDATAVAEQS
jgi:2-iminobutanoate/2-iminopropanoate deaminase